MPEAVREPPLVSTAVFAWTKMSPVRLLDPPGTNFLSCVRLIRTSLVDVLMVTLLPQENPEKPHPAYLRLPGSRLSTNIIF